MILFFSIRLASNAFVMVNLIFLCYCTDSVYISIYFAIVSELFGKKTVSLNMGLLLLGYGMVGIPVFVGFGVLYDNMTKSGNGLCYGIDCFSSMFLACGVALTFTAVMISWFSLREWKWRRNKT